MKHGFIKAGVFAPLLLLGLTQPAWSGSSSNIGNATVSIEDLALRADRGDPDAQFFLGTLYESGLEIEQDYAEATRLYREAAENDFVRAQYHLALLYEIGEGVGRDYEKAAQWYRRAANNGYPPAQNSLARLYLVGRGVEQDPLQAHMWSSLAVSQGLEQATRNRSKAALYLSSDELSRSRDLVQEWRARHMPGQGHAGGSKGD